MNRIPAHNWNISFQEAREIQEDLARQVQIHPLDSEIRHVAGFDVSYLKKDNTVIGGMVVLEYPSLHVIDKFITTDRIHFPYIPGYLSFREAPIILKLIEKYHHLTDLFMFDGHGIAHPRRLGIAAHIGVISGKPSIGCAKKRLIGEYSEPGKRKGENTRLMDRQEEIGRVLRTKKGIKPVFVSVGNLINLPEAVQLTLNCCTRYRLPEPTRLAHLTVTTFRRQQIETGSTGDKQHNFNLKT
jgi:deoxyribonuclease V